MLCRLWAATGSYSRRFSGFVSYLRSHSFNQLRNLKTKLYRTLPQLLPRVVDTAFGERFPRRWDYKDWGTPANAKGSCSLLKARIPTGN